MGKISTAIQSVGLTAKKYSPEILAAVGGIGTIAAIVLACKATTKASDILEEHKKSVEEIHEVKENEEYAEEYDEKDYKKDLTIVYSHTVMKLVKIYGPAILTAAGSLFCMFAAVNILKKRNAALTMACTTLASTFANYRQRVKDRYGEDKEFEIYHDIRETEEVEVTTDKNGKEKTKVKKVKLPGGMGTPFAITFAPTFGKDEEGNPIKNPYWTGDRDTDICQIRAIERYCNDMLIAKGKLTLNEVREQFGLPGIREGQFFGWVRRKNNPNGDNYIDFRIVKDSVNYLDYMNKKNDFIILDLNCDGDITNYYPTCMQSC